MTKRSSVRAAAAVVSGILIAGCGSSHPPSSETSSPPDHRYASPAAPIAELSAEGKHCFASPGDVAAAAARITAYSALETGRIARERAAADAGGPLPAYGSDTIARVSDPDADNCVTVTRETYVP